MTYLTFDALKKIHFAKSFSLSLPASFDEEVHSGPVRFATGSLPFGRKKLRPATNFSDFYVEIQLRRNAFRVYI